MKRGIFTGSFKAHSEDGHEYTIHIYTEYPTAKTFDSVSISEGWKELETSDELSVNRIEKGLYEIVELGIRVRSDSDDAP